MTRRLTCFVLTLAVALGAAAPASASLSDEVSAGQSLARQLQAGETTCDRLVPPDFERLGEYA